jgi:hypothetical protein
MEAEIKFCSRFYFSLPDISGPQGNSIIGFSPSLLHKFCPLAYSSYPTLALFGIEKLHDLGFNFKRQPATFIDHLPSDICLENPSQTDTRLDHSHPSRWRTASNQSRCERASSFATLSSAASKWWCKLPTESTTSTPR